MLPCRAHRNGDRLMVVIAPINQSAPEGYMRWGLLHQRLSRFRYGRMPNPVLTWE